MIYVLLALSVIVSLFGIVNTLALAVFERTREIGMLRAVGMTRRQARRMIRHEAMMTSLLGAALGLPVGVALAALATQGSAAPTGSSLSVPVPLARDLRRALARSSGASRRCCRRGVPGSSTFWPRSRTSSGRHVKRGRGGRNLGPRFTVSAWTSVRPRPMRRIAATVAAEWGVELGEPFALSRYSYVAPAGDGAVLKVAWEGDDESLHEAEALELWDGDGAVRLLRATARRALLEERARPGDDISELPEDEAIGDRRRRRRAALAPAGEPFRWIGDHVPRWIDNGAEREGSELIPLARELYAVARRRPATGSSTATSTTTTSCATATGSSRSTRSRMLGDPRVRHPVVPPQPAPVPHDRRGDDRAPDRVRSSRPGSTTSRSAPGR